jgi:hypothetical protein
MAVIPPDAGLRMRTQADLVGHIQSLAPVRGIPADLPEFQAGQSFTARIQEVLPDNTYKALIAGRELTLQLPEGASPGDLLELTVVDRTTRMLIAKRAESQPAPTQAETRPYQFSKISDAGRLIGQLLPAEGEAPPPAALNRGQPVVSQPPATGRELAPALQKAVTQSGVFYEAHQAQWVAGQRTLTSLRTEPQGQLPVMLRPTATATTPSGAMPNERAMSAAIADFETAGFKASGLEGAARSATPSATTTEATRERALAAGPRTDTPATNARSETGGRVADTATHSGESHAASAATGAGQQSPSLSVPEGIRSIVQQQLDAVATQRLAWHGEVWPGQSMDWTIQRDQIEERDANAGESGETQRWNTSLRLTMPRLGTIDAILQLSGNRLRIRLATTDVDAANDLQRQGANLTESLSKSGVSVQSLEVRHES